MPRYYGWYIVAIGALILMLAVGSTINAFGLFILPVSAEFGLSRASMNTAIILLNFGMALSSVFVGRMLDTRSIRTVMAISAVLLGALWQGLACRRISDSAPRSCSCRWRWAWSVRARSHPLRWWRAGSRSAAPAPWRWSRLAIRWGRS